MLDSNDVLALSQLDSNRDINVKAHREVGIQPDDVIQIIMDQGLIQRLLFTIGL